MKTTTTSPVTPTIRHRSLAKWRGILSLVFGLLTLAVIHRVHGGTIYSANFDSGNDGYTNIANGAFSNLWHRSSIRSASPGFSQYYGLEAATNYNTGARNAGFLQSPPISLAAAFAPVTLSFNYSLITEGNGAFDVATVAVSTNGGANWTTLASSQSGAFVQGSSFNNWTGDLSAYVGSTILLRFSFDTVDGIANTFQGWFVDDVMISAPTAAAYVRSTVGQPWGGSENETAMTTVFGTNWSDLRYETVNPAALFNGTTRFIFMEGSEALAQEMAAFLTTNQSLISNWVAAGGSLFLNAAPNEGGNIDFGFGVTLNYGGGTSTSSAEAANPAHPIFNGPFTPVGTSFTGGAFGHAVISGTGLTPLLTNASQTFPILAEKPYRFGHVICGGITTPSWAHAPQPHSTNLLANIIAHGAAQARASARPQVAVFDNPAYVDTTSASPNAESDNVQASLTNRGFAMVTFTNIVEAAAANHVLLIPDLEVASLAPALTAAERSALSNHVVGGGSLIVHGNSGLRAAALINSVLGLSVVEAGISISNNLTAAAIGTQFADDPAVIPLQNATRALQKTSLPPGSRSIYETNGLSIVAEMYFGAGKVIYLGWDWFGAAPIGVNDAGWLQVLESAVLERSLTPFYDDFDDNIDLGQWSEFGGTPGVNVLATNFGGSISGANALWFGNAGSRFAASRSLNTLGGGTVDFWLRLGNAGNPFDAPELPNDAVVLEYSNSGGTWVELGRYDTAAYQTWSHVITDIPLAAQTSNTRFRWRQLANSGANFDHWALDNVGVFAPRGPAILTQPAFVSVPHGGNAIYNVTANGAAPLFYYWRRNGVVIPGATSSIYTTNNVSLSDNGALFSCIVSNTFGTATSSDAPLFVTALGLVSIPSGNVAESNALATTLPTLGFNVQIITQGQWSAGSIVVGYPGMNISGPSLADIANGVRFVKTSDHGADWTANAFSSIGSSNINLVLDAAHPITTGLPASWTARGFWHYGLPGNEYVGWSTETALPSLVSVTNPVTQSRVLVAKTIGGGRAVFMGWSVYGPDAGPNDLAALRNAILWSATPVTSPAITSQYDAGLNTLTLSWPEPGFRLQTQTNSTAIGLSNNWVNYPGGNVSPVVITPNRTNPAVFFRLVTP